MCVSKLTYLLYLLCMLVRTVRMRTTSKYYVLNLLVLLLTVILRLSKYKVRVLKLVLK